jgi:ribosomal protein S18 acetylase RimI-like enzyme
MFTIEPIQPHQVNAAKYVISAVAQRIFYPDRTTQEFAEILDAEHELDDVDHFQTEYNERKGLFLVILSNNTDVVGSGAIKSLTPEIAELKRLWLLEEYHGQGLGYRVVMQLFDFARSHGYKLVYLQTSHQQLRAIAFYQRIGFVEIPTYNDNEYDDISMEFRL